MHDDVERPAARLLHVLGESFYVASVELPLAVGRGHVPFGLRLRRAERFYAAIRRYWPGLPDGALAPGYAGIRPKISGPKDPAADFMLQGPAEHGVPGLVNLFGIESPGLTASLALADDVDKLLQA